MTFLFMRADILFRGGIKNRGADCWIYKIFSIYLPHMHQRPPIGALHDNTSGE